MHISFGKNFRDTIPLGKEMSFGQFIKLVTELPIHTGRLHWTEYCLAGKQERSRDKDTRWFIPAVFVRPERRADAVGSLTGFVCDFDNGAITRGHIEAFGEKYGASYVAWTSYSNGLEGKEKWRVFYPYKEPIAPQEHEKVFEWFNKEFGGHLDPRCATVSQLWYLRGRPTGAPPGSFFSVDTGENIDIRALGSCGDRASNIPHGGAGTLPVGTLSTLAARAAKDNDDLIARGPPSIIDIKSALAALDPNLYEDYTEWLNTGMSIYDGTAGSVEGLDIFDAWSATVPKYLGREAIEQKWASFGRRQGLRRRTVASLFKQARDAGWEPTVNPAPGSPHIPAPAVPVSKPEPIASVAPDVGNSASAVLSVPLVTAPTSMPANWKIHTSEVAMQRLEDHPETEGARHWVTRVRNTRLIGIEMLEAIGGGPNGMGNLEFRCADKTRIVRLELGLLAGGRKADLRTELAANGVLLNDDDFKCFQELTVDWLNKIKRESKVKRSLGHFGWLEENHEHIGFAAGTSAYYADGRVDTDIQITNSPGSLAAHYKPVGSITPWRAIAEYLIGQRNQALLTVLASAFASPLVKFSGVSGVVVSVISNASGVGKSSALAVAQAVWGDPKGAIHAATDTPLSLSKKMGFTKNLPAYWDDIKGEKTFESFSELLFQITQGKEKSRLDQQANLRDIQTWDCLALVAANDSIVDAARRYASSGSDAGPSRIFEIRIEDRPLQVMPASFFDGCRSNYGHVGAQYAQWLATHRETAEQLVIKATERLSAELDMKSDERFWVAVIACIVAGAGLAKYLGYVDFDVPALRAFLVNRFHRLRTSKGEAVAEIGADRQVADMIYDHQRVTLVISSIQKFNKGVTTIVRLPASDEVHLLIIRDDHLLRVRKTKFYEWCRSRGLSADTLRTKLEAAGALKERNTDPMGGAPGRSQGRTSCYDIDLKVLRLNAGDDDVDPQQDPT